MRNAAHPTRCGIPETWEDGWEFLIPHSSFLIPNSVEVDILDRLLPVVFLFRFVEELAETIIHEAAFVLFPAHGFLHPIGRARSVSAQLLEPLVEVRLFVMVDWRFMRDNHPGFGVHVDRRTAVGALDLEFVSHGSPTFLIS